MYLESLSWTYLIYLIVILNLLVVPRSSILDPLGIPDEGSILDPLGASGESIFDPLDVPEESIFDPLDVPEDPSWTRLV